MRATPRGPWLLAALHVPFVAIGPASVIPRQGLGLGAAELLGLVSVAIGGLQLRHSLATARGVRPAGALWTFLLIGVLVYVPMWFYGFDWAVMQWFVCASAIMVLPGRLGFAVAALPMAGQTVAAARYVSHEPAAGPGLSAVFTVYLFTLLMMGTTAIVGSAWLARTLSELDAAQREQATLAAVRERVRMSRDLHDLLGHSLATASLKGQLALSLLPADPSAARAEMAGLAAAARRALDDIRAVTRDEHAVSLRAELADAVALLRTAGVHTAVDVAAPDLPAAVDEVFGWTVREAATNTLRHSGAAHWSATVRRTGGRITLTVENDGAPAGGRAGGSRSGGLAGVAARARALSGRTAAGPADGGRFRVEVDVPEEPR